jgi:LysR family transcriptional regulator, glycine cleavage system transcriptional activator
MKTHPPFNALKAFEATARHLSFSKAAIELHVTPAALSHQVRGLEDLLGQKLFHRRARSIELTDTGRLLYPDLRLGFETIRAAVARVDRGRNDRVLVISATPGLTAKWLVPRLYRFLQANPEIDARVSASYAYVDFDADGVDVALRMSPGDHPGLYVKKLMDEAMVPVCHPKLLEGPNGLRKPADLARFTLIHLNLPFGDKGPPTWGDWLEAAGVTGVDASRGLSFNVADHAQDAAMEGTGVMLAYKTMAASDLRSGRLVVPFGPELPLVNRAYHFVCPQGHETHPLVRAFRNWVFAEVERDRPGGGPL